jgi:hypothetical protein
MTPFRQFVITTTSCATDGCPQNAPGHALHLTQRRAAAATSGKWRDSVVTHVTPDGWITLASIHDGSATRVWQHAGEAPAVTVGDPVALHGLYNVLARGAEWHSVLIEQNAVKPAAG